MNYLQACQKTHLRLRIGSRGNTAKPGSVPTSTTGQTDELAELVEWVGQSYTDLQTMRPTWGWMIQSGSVAFGAGVASLSLPTIVATLTNYRELVPYQHGRCEQYVNSYITSDFTTLAATPMQQVIVVPWDYFQGHFTRGPVSSGRPIYITTAPDQSLRIYPTPDRSYTMVFDYRVKPKILTPSDGAVNLDDYPATGAGLPVEHHDIIVWMAAKKWAESRNDANVFATAEANIKKHLIELRRTYLQGLRL